MIRLKLAKSKRYFEINVLSPTADETDTIALGIMGFNLQFFQIGLHTKVTQRIGQLVVSTESGKDFQIVPVFRQYPVK